MLYYLILGLQIYCLYHAYTRRVEIWWYILIFLFPLIGCGIYLFKHINTPYAMDTIGNIVEEVKETVDTGYRARKLEAQLDFSDTVQNKLILGTEYMNKGYYEDAFALFESCNNGVFKNDSEVLSKLVASSFMLRDFDTTIKYGEEQAFLNEIGNDKEKTALAWAYHYAGRKEDADLLFRSFDKSYGAYYQRNELIKYLRETNDLDTAHRKLDDLLSEVDSMGRHERRANAEDIKAIKATARSF